MTRANVQPDAEPMAVSIERAAKMVGVSRRYFYDVFLSAGRVRPVVMGRRKLILVEELRRAFTQFVAERRAAQGDAPIADLPCFDASKASR